MNWRSLELLFWEFALCVALGGLFGHLAALFAPRLMLLAGLASVVAIHIYVGSYEDEAQ